MAHVAIPRARVHRPANGLLEPRSATLGEREPSVLHRRAGLPLELGRVASVQVVRAEQKGQLRRVVGAGTVGRDVGEVPVVLVSEDGCPVVDPCPAWVLARDA